MATAIAALQLQLLALLLLLVPTGAAMNSTSTTVNCALPALFAKVP